MTFAGPHRVRWVACGAILLAAVAVSIALQAHGLAARRIRAGGAVWVEVRDASSAYGVWKTAGVTGRRLLVLTGRWATVPLASLDPMPGRALSPTADTVVFLAARDRIAREIEVVMPRARFEERRAQASGAKTFAPSGEGFRQDFHGYARRFSPVSAPPASDEPFLVLVEPSFFEDDAPADLPRWLAEHGIRFDVGVLARWDAAAGDEALGRTARLADALRGAR